LEALEHSVKALNLQPDLAPAWVNRAHALRGLRRLDEALASFERAVLLAPSSIDAHAGRGDVLLSLRRYDDAVDSYDRALQINPAHIESLNNRGSALRRSRRLREAIDSYESALRLEPDSPDVLSNLANVYLGLERLDDALRCCERALALQPGLAGALNIRATIQRDLGRQEAAADSYARLHRVAPDFDYATGNYLFARANCCDWTDAEPRLALARSVLDGHRRCLPFSFLSMSDSAAAQLQCARTFVADRCPLPAPHWSGHAHPHQQIRVAYVSGDFGEHAVSFLLAGLFESHDRDLFDTYAISLRPEEHSPMGQRVKRAFSRFIDVSGRDDREVGALMRELEIDIAVDLVGYTAGMRPELFAQRGAPIQVNYVGFPGTMGADYYDYLIADEFVVPHSLRQHYSEKVVHLPDCFQSFDHRREAVVSLPSRAALNLPERGFVFCSFNNSYKLNPELFDVWMQLLQRVPMSVLWLLGSRDTVRQRLRAEAKFRGVDPERLVFASRCPYPDHLARLPLADLFLDSLPFNAGATASDALSMGLPVLTVSGEAFAARMAGSLLNSLRLPELIADNFEEYSTTAVRLAHEPAQLQSIRQRLAASRSTAAVFDTERFCRHLESAYTAMWQRWQRGDQPASFSVPRQGPSVSSGASSARYRR
jgi:predicted O-linked N-acetylglucosamine transferase (SPINDLY family)